MTKDKLKALFALGSLVTVIGIILLFFSIKFGESLAHNWLVKRGGGSDTSTYLIIFEGYTNIFLSAGSILLVIGLATTIFVYYKILSIDE
ncbi:hypothetical protein MHZ92_18485 [Sporosarcina sp. ACRSL]|uniref:hypothetical protein n=1 Tax=Sporosarcina sp. ACRSL TaxID=2918215 RepID=UPI001EF5D646|nr:hypothetical protein [Sporosarcina sp. ACRSL]MCG7346101.1 hypothetical protein [Sporosarcina sp. ACRSL]